MKPGLAVLLMDNWADVFVYPWISRRQLAQIVHRFKERAFAKKLQKFLHDPKCGKHSLRYLGIKQSPEYQTYLNVAPREYGIWHVYEDREFPESEMPDNINSFEGLSIWHFDDQVLDFLNKIKPLFTDVFLDISCLSLSAEQARNVRILLGHLQPMLSSIRGIRCRNERIEFLEQHCSCVLAMANELFLFNGYSETAFIPAYLRWLSTPRDFDGPRFFATFARSKTIFAMIEAVRQQFMAATTSSTFVILLHFYYNEHHIRVEEFTMDKAVTNEQLTVRNGIFERPKGYDIHYVEIKRHPKGADAIMRDWIKGRAYYEKKYKDGHDIEVEADMDVGKHIWIEHPTIGLIAKKGGEMMKQDEAGPSNSAKRMKK